MALDEAIRLLDLAALDGEIDITKWSNALDGVLARLDNIVQTTFPIPTTSSSPKSTQLTPDSSSVEPPSQTTSSQRAALSSDKLNATPADSQQLSQSVKKQLPGSLQAFYDSIKTNLINSFATKPPYTIQRLAELLLVPTEHYRTLPAFLRAVDRVVSVSSTADIFPLPYTALESNGTLGSGPDDFNGAALSRIPWLKDEKGEWLGDSAEMLGLDDESTRANADLRTESTALIDGPNGAGSVETVTVTMNGVEQSSSQAAAQGDQALADNVKEDSNDSVESQERAEDNDSSGTDGLHARGPEEIGVQDTGPQKALAGNTELADSVEAAERAVGRPGEGQKAATETNDSNEKNDPDSMSLTNEENEQDQQ